MVHAASLALNIVASQGASRGIQETTHEPTSSLSMRAAPVGGLLVWRARRRSSPQDYPQQAGADHRARSPPAARPTSTPLPRASACRSRWARPSSIDDRPGAGSIIGTDAVAKSPPDGYTLLLMSNTHTVNESLIPTKPFQLMRDFAPIAPINSSDLVLVARSSSAGDDAAPS